MGNQPLWKTGSREGGGLDAGVDGSGGEFNIAADKGVELGEVGLGHLKQEQLQGSETRNQTEGH